MLLLVSDVHEKTAQVKLDKILKGCVRYLKLTFMSQLYTCVT